MATVAGSLKIVRLFDAQAHPDRYCFYSTSKKGVRAECLKPEDASTFEVAIIDENLSEDEQQWDVLGWQTREEINKLMVEHG